MANRVFTGLVKSSLLFKEQSCFAQIYIQMLQQPQKRHLTESSKLTHKIKGVSVIQSDSLARSCEWLSHCAPTPPFSERC